MECRGWCTTVLFVCCWTSRREEEEKNTSLEFFMTCYAAIAHLLLQILMTWEPHLNVWWRLYRSNRRNVSG